MAQQCNTKSSALCKDQVMLLLDLIAKHKVITSKATNATNNKLKDEAWKIIAEAFNATTGDFRRPEQLRLKWENLKKAARKRSAIIRQNNIKTGGGKTFVSPDESLDRVASILGATCTGTTFPVEFGGDKENIVEEETIQIINFEPLPEPSQQENILVAESDGFLDCGVGASGCQTNIAQKQFLFNTPKNSLNKKRKLTEEVQKAKRDKDLALAAYFQAKAEKVKLENEKLKIEIENLKKQN